MNDTVGTVGASLAMREPILIGHGAVLLVALLGELLVGPLHVLSAAQWGPLQSWLVPVVTTLLLGLSAGLTRAVVTPMARFAVPPSAGEPRHPSPGPGIRHPAQGA